MKDFDHVMMWVFVLAAVAVFVGSHKADALISSVSDVMSKMINVIGSGQN